MSFCEKSLFSPLHLIRVRSERHHPKTSGKNAKGGSMKKVGWSPPTQGVKTVEKNTLTGRAQAQLGQYYIKTNTAATAAA
jgi:hypothetical protein